MMRGIGGRAVLGVVICAGAVWAMGQESQPGAGRMVERVADFGKVSVEKGPVRGDYDFKLTNGRGGPVRITGVQKSCGCLDAKVDDTELDAGETTVLHAGLTVTATGQTVQKVSVVFSDGSVEQFSLTAYGTLPVELTAIPEGPLRDGKGKWAFQFYYIDTVHTKLPETPRVYGPEGVKLECGNWVTLERPGPKKVRPRRMVMDAHLDFSEYNGGFPVEVDIRCQNGAACKAKVVLVLGMER